jgi:hypothetical protein
MKRQSTFFPSYCILFIFILYLIQSSKSFISPNVPRISLYKSSRLHGISTTQSYLESLSSSTINSTIIPQESSALFHISETLDTFSSLEAFSKQMAANFADTSSTLKIMDAPTYSIQSNLGKSVKEMTTTTTNKLSDTWTNILAGVTTTTTVSAFPTSATAAISQTKTSSSVQPMADRPVSELGESAVQLVSQVAHATVGGLETIGNHLFPLLDSLVKSLSGTSISEMVMALQESIHKV